ncbi:hypothetical protein HDU67_010421 [Dinochytrium kinnereticum]|nr:hypothetical protein HDU67_010421 [Dinochytrium kinnereticum]
MPSANDRTYQDLELQATTSPDGQARYPPSSPPVTEEGPTKVIAKTELRYGKRPDYFSNDLPAPLQGIITPEEFARRITTLNNKLASFKSIKDDSIVMFTWIRTVSTIFALVGVVSFILYFTGAVKSAIVGMIALAVVLVDLLPSLFFYFFSPPKFEVGLDQCSNQIPPLYSNHTAMEH